MHMLNEFFWHVFKPFGKIILLGFWKMGKVLLTKLLKNSQKEM